MEKSVAIQLQGLTKVFGSVVANNHVSLDIYKGEILSILGENGQQPPIITILFQIQNSNVLNSSGYLL